MTSKINSTGRMPMHESLLNPVTTRSSFGFTMSNHEFRQFKEYIHHHFGINLTESKRSLFMGRVQKVMRNRGFSKVGDYYKFITSGADPHALIELIDKISTNHTFFYRESSHFEELKKKILPELTSRLSTDRKMELRIWCAAASSGEEPYTIAMVLKDVLGNKYSDWNTGVLATDISEDILVKAREGVYPEEQVNNLPKLYRKVFFNRTQDGKREVSPSIKNEVLFRRFNLLNKLPFKKPFHMIFMRNVMIYFDTPTKKALLDRVFDFIYPGGYLFIGHAESLNKLNTKFKYIKPALYQRPMI